jgi:hypothetical protein
VQAEELHEAARAFLEGDVDLMPGALAAPEVERLVAFLVGRSDMARLQRLGESRDKAVAKAARKAVHLLRTRGVPAPAPEKKVYRLKGPYAPESDTPSMASIIDGRGERVMWLARVTPDGFDVFQAETSETRGLVGFSVGSVSKKDWRSHVSGILNAEKNMVVRAASSHVRWLIEQAYERTLAAGRTLPEEFARARLDLGPVDKPEHHPALDLAPPLAVEEARARGASLHELPECASWIPPEDAVAKLDVELGQIATSKLVVSHADRADQVARAIEKLADEALTPHYRALLAERLHETALILVARHAEDEARLATAVAAWIADESVGGADNRFVRGLFEKLAIAEEKK